LLGAESGLSDLPIDEDGPLGDPRKKKKGASGELDSPATPSGTLFTSTVPRRAQSAKSAAHDALHCIQRTDGPTPTGTTTTKTTHQAAYLRSFRLPYPKAAVAAKVSQIATELGIALSRLVVPTRDTLAHHEALLEAITALVEMKKVADRVDQEIRTAKIRLGMRESEPPGEARMDVDEDAQGPDTPAEGRAQSVVSTRSGRSRKQTGTTNDRRSMSVSSVDTSATSTTRAGTKRQKLG